MWSSSSICMTQTSTEIIKQYVNVIVNEISFYNCIILGIWISALRLFPHSHLHKVRVFSISQFDPVESKSSIVVSFLSSIAHSRYYKQSGNNVLWSDSYNGKQQLKKMENHNILFIGFFFPSEYLWIKVFCKTWFFFIRLIICLI